MAMRSSFNKVNLHHSECANGVILRDLTGTDCPVVVPLDCGCCYIETLPGADLGKKRRMVYANEANIWCPLFSKNVNCTFPYEMKQAQSELRHRFDQKDSRINGMAGKVSSEHRICRVNEPFSPEPRRFQIDCRDSIHEQKRIAMWNQPFNLIAPDIDIARRSRRLPEFPP
jgi:hypothetical protein